MKVLVFVFVALFIIFGIGMFWQDDSGGSLIERWGQSDGGTDFQGQQTGQTGGSGDGTTGGDGQDETGSGGEDGGGFTEGGGALINSQFGYITSYDTIGQSLPQTDLSPTLISTEYNWINSNTANIVLSVTIENSGEQTSFAYTVEFTFNNAIREVVVPAMPALSFYVAHVTYNNINIGNYNAVIVVDKNNEVTEADENNNRAEQEVFV